MLTRSDGASALAVAAPRVSTLDGLRGLACLLVVVWHYAAFPWPGAWPDWYEALHRVIGLNWAGVDLFFVLSGYLLGTVCLRHRAAEDYFRTFYTRRACRILPLYYVWLALGLAAAHLAGSAWNDGPAKEEPLWPYLALVQNFTFARAGAYGAPWLAVTWSLAVEAQFYLVLPAVVRWVPTRWLPGVLLAALPLALASRVLVVTCWPAHTMAAYWLLPCRCDALALGVLAAWLGHEPQWRDWLRANLSRLRLAFAALGAIMLVLLAVSPSKQAPLTATLGYTAIDLFWFVLVLLACHDVRAARFLQAKPLCRLGTVSYGVYLFHVGVAYAIHGALRGASPALGDGAAFVATGLAVAASIGLAWLAFRLVELPLQRLAPLWPNQACRPLPGSRAAIVVAQTVWQPLRTAGAYRTSDFSEETLVEVVGKARRRKRRSPVRRGAAA